MQSIQSSDVQSSQVSALFAGSEISFCLSKGATFADLAESLDQLSDRVLGHALAIYLKFGVTDQPVSVLRTGI
jgi:hypothetical protein